jgi:uncharacterized protein (DUF362 family)
MSKSGQPEFSRRTFLGVGVGVVATVGCSDDGSTSGTSTGGTETGGTSSGGATTGGTSSGGLGTGGTSAGGTGGGGLGTGGLPTGGAGTGGLQTGGASTGGAGTGGVSTGGALTGGAPTGGAATGGVATGGVATGGAATGGAETGGAETGGAGTGGAPSTGSGLVALARAATVEESTRTAVTMAGGLGFVAGTTVLIKPNLNSSDPAPCSPSVGAMNALVEMCFDAGAARVIVADRSNPSYTTFGNMQAAGWYESIQTLGAEPMDLDGMPTRHIAQPDYAVPSWPDGFDMYELFFDGTVDHVINLCCCKDHGLANFTMSLKAWMGIITQPSRNTAHENLGDRLPELHVAVRESLSVLDASKCNLTNGPFPGEQADSNVIVASTDPVAVDATGVAILKYWLQQRGVSNSRLDPAVWDQPQLVHAMQIGLGITDRSQYSHQAQGVDEIDDIMAYLNA